MPVNPSFAVAVFVTIVIIAIIIAWVSNPEYFEETKIRVFIICLAGLGIVLTFLFYYSILTLEQEQQNLTRLQQTTILGEDLLNGVLIEIEKSVPIIPDFALSLLPLQNNCQLTLDANRENQIIDQVYQVTRDKNLTRPLTSHKLHDLYSTHHSKHHHLTAPSTCAAMAGKATEYKLGELQANVTAPDPCSPEAIVRRVVLSTRIFSVWQQVSLYGDTIDITPLAYVTNFLQRANSRQLFGMWQTMKINFNEETQEFGDLLFCYGLQITEQTPEAYVAAAKALLANPCCKALGLHL